MRAIAIAAALLPIIPGGARQAPADPLAARTKGRGDAPVTVYEMADFQCPACRGFALTVLPALDREFVATGKVRWVYINFPLTRIHPNATPAAEAAMCVARQRRFWEMHDLLFEHQSEWAALAEPRPALVALGVRAGAKRAQLQTCVATRATRGEVEDDARRAARAGARATPSFYIEGGLLEGAPPTAQPFRLLLDSVYRARTSAAPK